MATHLCIISLGSPMEFSKTSARLFLMYLTQYNECCEKLDMNSIDFAYTTKLLSDFTNGNLRVNSIVHDKTAHIINIGMDVARNIYVAYKNYTKSRP